MKYLDSFDKLLGAVLAVVVTGAAAMLMFGLTLTVMPQPAQANPAVAQKTGLPCAKCHTRPPALTSYGQKYKSGKR